MLLSLLLEGFLATAVRILGLATQFAQMLRQIYLEIYS